MGATVFQRVLARPRIAGREERMTITTEEAEWLAVLHEHDAMRFAPGMPGRELRQNTAAALRSLAAERDALQAEKINLQDDLSSAERERAHQHGRADRNAAEYAREQGKREALAARVAELEGLVAYLCGRNPDHIQVALAGNPTVVDAVIKRAEAALEGKKDV
jgi:chromosome segregation ATPase